MCLILRIEDEDLDETLCAFCSKGREECNCYTEKEQLSRLWFVLWR
jgi:hypothetical protein